MEEKQFEWYLSKHLASELKLTKKQRRELEKIAEKARREFADSSSRKKKKLQDQIDRSLTATQRKALSKIDYDRARFLQIESLQKAREISANAAAKTTVNGDESDSADRNSGEGGNER